MYSIENKTPALTHEQEPSKSQTQFDPELIIKSILKKVLTTDKFDLFKYSFLKQLRWLIQLSQKNKIAHKDFKEKLLPTWLKQVTEKIIQIKFLELKLEHLKITNKINLLKSELKAEPWLQTNKLSISDSQPPEITEQIQKIASVRGLVADTLFKDDLPKEFPVRLIADFLGDKLCKKFLHLLLQMTLDPALNFMLNSTEDKIIQDIELLKHEKKEILADPDNCIALRNKYHPDYEQQVNEIRKEIIKIYADINYFEKMLYHPKFRQICELREKKFEIEQTLSKQIIYFKVPEISKAELLHIWKLKDNLDYALQLQRQAYFEQHRNLNLLYQKALKSMQAMPLSIPSADIKPLSFTQLDYFTPTLPQTFDLNPTQQLIEKYKLIQKQIYQNAIFVQTMENLVCLFYKNINFQIIKHSLIIEPASSSSIYYLSLQIKNLYDYLSDYSKKSLSLCGAQNKFIWEDPRSLQPQDRLLLEQWFEHIFKQIHDYIKSQAPRDNIVELIKEHPLLQISENISMDEKTSLNFVLLVAMNGYVQHTKQKSQQAFCFLTCKKVAEVIYKKDHA